MIFKKIFSLHVLKVSYINTYKVETFMKFSDSMISYLLPGSDALWYIIDILTGICS